MEVRAVEYFYDATMTDEDQPDASDEVSWLKH